MIVDYKLHYGHGNKQVRDSHKKCFTCRRSRRYLSMKYYTGHIFQATTFVMYPGLRYVQICCRCRCDFTSSTFLYSGPSSKFHMILEELP